MNGISITKCAASAASMAESSFKAVAMFSCLGLLISIGLISLGVQIDVAGFNLR